MMTMMPQVSEVKRRNQDVRELLSRLHFADDHVLPPLKPEDLYEGDLNDEEAEIENDDFLPGRILKGQLHIDFE